MNLSLNRRSFLSGSGALVVAYAMDGPAAATAIRAMGYTGKIFGVTDSVLPSYRQHFVQAGATVVYPKPVNVGALLRAI